MKVIFKNVDLTFAKHHITFHAGEVLFSGASYAPEPNVNKLNAVGGYGHGYAAATGDANGTLRADDNCLLEIKNNATITKNTYFTGYVIPFAYGNCKIKITNGGIETYGYLVFAFKHSDGTYTAYNINNGIFTNVEITTPSDCTEIILNSTGNNLSVSVVDEY